MNVKSSTGPLTGVKVLELAGIGPSPFCCMLLADMGADVLRVDRTEPADIGVATDPAFQLLNRGRRSIAVDLKKPEGVALVMELVADSDVLVEGFRPGVTERLGLGPTDCQAVNPRLVYGRMTGWGQEGPLAQAAGHDINYIALTGALDAIGERHGPPVPPLNLVGDFGGGALYLAFGILCALHEARSSGMGQVVDGAIIDGTAHLLTSVFARLATGDWAPRRGENLLDGSRPWYGVYETSDGLFVTVGAIENRFYRELLERTGLAGDPALRDRDDPAMYPVLRARLAAVFRTRTRAEWEEAMKGTNACFAPVMGAHEAASHDHMKARGVLVEAHGVLQPAPAPRFSRSTPSIRRPPPLPGQHTREILQEQGHDHQRIEQWFMRGVVA
ncbi:CaiB/BaiF CoA-transferase family protein [Variovorax sp. J31P207]|uniref:CaiB/BaiF CoA transferase family protein n=1 Tax=Variovorax sp. J31P207 TaxID=3053510 RepID=UPI00257685AD|nr:CaiB/BaiF CoA-transferase family protein [Variovorax sp. J31P207]MDM0069972.1 CaiB/BaiF CoA-transferase family protein [Variovorax sp. J31P207]